MRGETDPRSCGKCGSEQSATARYCSRCGALLELGETLALPTTHRDPILSDEPVRPNLSPGEALLVVQQGPTAGQSFRVDKVLTTIGRDPASDVFLDDVTVSRRHAEIHRSYGGFLIRDVGSLNGTYVGSDRADEAELTRGERVRIGRFVFVFLTGA